MEEAAAEETDDDVDDEEDDEVDDRMAPAGKGGLVDSKGAVPPFLYAARAAMPDERMKG